MVDLLIRGGTVVTPGGTGTLDVAIEGERIAAVAAPGVLTEARRVIDATGKLVVPGGVDPHCHWNLGWRETRSEGQEHSWAAAWGGTTTIVDFAFREGDTSLHDAVLAKRAEADGAMAVDYGLHALLAGNTSFEVMEEIGDVIRGGIPTIKTLTTYGWMSDDGHRFGVMSEVAANGGMSIVHAEDDALANWLTAKYVREGRTHGGWICETRGPLVEELGIRRCLLLAERTGSPIYVFHMAAASGVHALAETQARGFPAFGETLIVYLSYTSEKLFDDENRGLLVSNFPTIKSQEDQDELWRAVADGRLQCVSSDHYGLSAETRYRYMGTRVETPQGGQNAVEMRLPVLYSRGVAEGRLSLERFVELSSTGPARLMGLYPRKGAIQPGSDADLVILDPERRWTVRAAEHHMGGDYNAWEGWELRGKVVTTLLRGTPLVEDERWVGSRTGGRYQPRTLDPAIVGRAGAALGP
ncbi:MAG: amidohydrolase family protein [Thermoleophilia bacterium]